MEWSNDETLVFVDLYKDHPVLWERQNTNYYNKPAKAEAWAEIACTMSKAPEDCRRKIVSLLSSLRRERARMRKSRVTGKGKEKQYRSSWFAYKSMKFLLDRTNPPKKATNENTKDDPDLSEERDPISIELKCEPPSAPTSTVPPRAPRAPRKRKVPDEDPRGKPARTIHLHSSIGSATTESECHYFGKFVANKLRGYSARTRSMAQHAIGNVIFNADQGLFESNEQSAVSLSYPAEVRYEVPVSVGVQRSPSSSRDASPVSERSASSAFSEDSVDFKEFV